MEILQVECEDGYILHVDIESPLDSGGILSYAVSGWAYDSDTGIMHYYERYNSLAVCGHYGRPIEVYVDMAELETFYSDMEETWYWANLCPDCMESDKRWRGQLARPDGRDLQLRSTSIG